MDTSTPMIRADHHSMVYAAANATVPSHLEAAVRATGKLNTGFHIVQSTPKARCQSLLVAHTLINANTRIFPVRIMNPTDKPLRLISRAPMAMASPVTIDPTSVHRSSYTGTATPSVTVADMRKELESQGISISDTNVCWPRSRPPHTFSSQ